MCVHFCLVGLPLLLDEIVDSTRTVGIVVSIVEFEAKFKPNAEQEIAQLVALFIQPFLVFQTAVEIVNANFQTLLWFPDREHAPQLALRRALQQTTLKPSISGLLLLCSTRSVWFVRFLVSTGGKPASEVLRP